MDIDEIHPKGVILYILYGTYDGMVSTIQAKFGIYLQYPFASEKNTRTVPYLTNNVRI